MRDFNESKLARVRIRTYYVLKQLTETKDNETKY